MNGYTLKYQYCFADKNMVEFLLCETGDSCKDGCENGNSYTIDFVTFVDAFSEAQMGAREYACEMVRENCEEDEEEDCYANAGYNYDYCMEDEDEFNVQEYLECAEFEDGYVGPYCADDGYSIYLGYYEDECYTLAAEGTFETAYGYVLPYSKESGDSIITGDDGCANCNEHALDQDQNEGDQEDEDDVLEQCEELVGGSYSKCEDGTDGDKSGCETIEELEESDPYVSSTKTSSNGGSSTAKRAFLFIGLAVAILACCGLSYFCYSKYSNQKEEDPTAPATSGPGYEIMGDGTSA